MASNALGIGHFTAENIVAVLRAIQDSDGTYAGVVENARRQGAIVGQDTVAKWVTQGHRDIEARKDTSFTRFTKQHDNRLNEHCGPETNRCRQLDRALTIMNRTCECGNEKPLAPNGDVDDQCRRCQELDGSRQGGNGRRPHQNGTEVGSARTGHRAQ